MRPLQDNISPDDENENGNDDNNINASDSKVIIVLYNRKNEKKNIACRFDQGIGELRPFRNNFS